MVKSLVILVDKSPLGSNSPSEAIRLGAGITAMDEISCDIVFMDDAVVLMNKKLNPEALNMDSFETTFRLAEFSEIILHVLQESLTTRGLSKDDLLSMENLDIISKKDLAKLIINADTTFRY